VPYTATTLQQFINRISYLLDDLGAVYWTTTEIQYATYEALRVWGAFTNYWRTRGTFQLNPASSPLLGNPYVDLSQVLPTLRTRTYTLDQMVREIQYMLLEAPNGLSGSQMSGQTNITTILNAIQDARNRFVNDTHLPLSILNTPPTLQPGGMCVYSENVAYVHTGMWQDVQMPGQFNGIWTTLWREDAWAADKNYPYWEAIPGIPEAFSEAENAPLQLQLYPAPVSSGNLELNVVLSLQMNLIDPNSTFNVPDEWVHAIKYAALSLILNSSNQINDPLRAEYCEQRYQQSIDAAVSMGGSVIRAVQNNTPVSLPLDTLYNMESANPYWRNQVGPPASLGVLYDMLWINPAFQDQLYGIGVDVVQTAPLPCASNVALQIGREDLEHIEKYVLHYLSFKCGGGDFKNTMAGYDEFMKAVEGRKAINKAKIRYLAPLFQQQQKEWQQRPDRMTLTNA
jgi:hypothetical protein